MHQQIHSNNRNNNSRPAPQDTSNTMVDYMKTITELKRAKLGGEGKNLNGKSDPIELLALIENKAAAINEKSTITAAAARVQKLNDHENLNKTQQQQGSSYDDTNGQPK